MWGHTSSAKRQKIIVVVPLHFLARQVQLVVLMTAFVMFSTVCSVSCLLLFYSLCPPCPAICKSGGTCPCAMWSWCHCFNIIQAWSQWRFSSTKSGGTAPRKGFWSGPWGTEVSQRGSGAKPRYGEEVLQKLKQNFNIQNLTLIVALQDGEIRMSPQKWGPGQNWGLQPKPAAEWIHNYSRSAIPPMRLLFSRDGNRSPRLLCTLHHGLRSGGKSWEPSWSWRYFMF